MTTAAMFVDSIVPLGPTADEASIADDAVIFSLVFGSVPPVLRLDEKVLLECPKVVLVEAGGAISARADDEVVTSEALAVHEKLIGRDDPESLAVKDKLLL